MRISRLFLLIWPWVLLPLFSHAQTKLFDDAETLQSVIFVGGDVVSIQCDTAFVMNKLTFRRYDSAYKDLRRKGSGITNLMSSYEEILGLQENRIKEQGKSYDELRSHFLTLSGTTQKQLNESSVRLSAAAKAMEALSSDLGETKRLLGEAKEIIEAEQRGLRLDKIVWGLGGVAAGLIVGVIVSK